MQEQSSRAQKSAGQLQNRLEEFCFKSLNLITEFIIYGNSQDHSLLAEGVEIAKTQIVKTLGSWKVKTKGGYLWSSHLKCK